MNTFSERPGAEQRKNSMRRVDFSTHPIQCSGLCGRCGGFKAIFRKYAVLWVLISRRSVPSSHPRAPPKTARRYRGSRNLFGFRRAAAAISPSPLSARAEAGSALRLSSASKASYRLDSRSHCLPATGHDWLISPPLLLPWLEICAPPPDSARVYIYGVTGLYT